jgi:hypothetical protein
MIIETNQLNRIISQRYPYDYRIKLSGDALADDKVSDWMAENSIPHTRVGWGVYYMKKEHVTWLVLRWS